MSTAKLTELSARWAAAKPAERANFQSYLIELCEALEVERPRPAGSGYEFEFAVKVINRDGTETTNFIDLYKKAHFLIEAKDQGSADTDTILLRKAYGQARTYAAALDESPPPYLMVLDVGRTLFIWDRWDFGYGGFSAAKKVNLATLSDNLEAVALLRDIFERPQSRNPNIRGTAVTKEIAAQLAELASSLELRGYDQERIARFLIRCVFTMFAEDTGLIPDSPFSTAVVDIGLKDPADFSVALADMWRAMDEGSRFGLKKFLRFNGHFFRDQEVLPLTKDDLLILKAAAEATWESVEPSIMGTLLVRALDPAERHRLGAEFTPREYVERVVRPTVEEPIRERWTAVQAEVLQLRSSSGLTDKTRRDRDKQAISRLRQFHEWLRSLRFLDPACGSGNFLYVTLAIVKQVELEVVRAVEEITGAPELPVEEVGPWQFHGIEIKPWAREIAELSLWIGYHQWWRRTHGHTVPPEPVLRDTGTLECRDAVLAWDDVGEDASRARPDPALTVVDPVTGRLVPDPAAVLKYASFLNPRVATWPAADFIIGNPPFLGNKRMREVFGDGYVEALRAAYPEVPESADYVMYWWHRAAVEVAAGRTTRAGLITTNSITQPYNRGVIAEATKRVSVIWAIATHPWVDEAGSAAVRVAMTVIAPPASSGARLVQVDEAGIVTGERASPRLNVDLSAHADVAAAAEQPLLANKGISSVGFWLVGDGFRLEDEEATRLLASDRASRDVIRPLINGRDLAARPRNMHVIDFAMRDDEAARAYPVVYDLLRSRVKAFRDANNDKSARERWWRFGRNREDLRLALVGLGHYIATPEVSKHTVFQFISSDVAAEHAVVCIASDSAFHLGVLSSTIHTVWARAAGGRLGVGNDPRYQKARCFDPFPFPVATEVERKEIARIAAQIDQHRKGVLARDAKVTITGLYNVLEKLRSRAELTVKERDIHTLGAVGLLRDMHEDLDSAVAAAYGFAWPADHDAILAHLVRIHDERRADEAKGEVHWLRPEYQRPLFGDGLLEEDLELDIKPTMPEVQAPEWPSNVIDQIRALQELLGRGPLTVEGAIRQFRGARKDMIIRHLDTLVVMGELQADPDGTFTFLKQSA